MADCEEIPSYRIAIWKLQSLPSIMHHSVFVTLILLVSSTPLIKPIESGFKVLATTYCQEFDFDDFSNFFEGDTTFTGLFKGEARAEDFDLSDFSTSSKTTDFSGSGTVKFGGSSYNPAGSLFKGRVGTKASRGKNRCCGSCCKSISVESGTGDSFGFTTSGAAGNNVKLVELTSDSKVDGDGTVRTKGSARATGRKNVSSFSKAQAISINGK